MPNEENSAIEALIDQHWSLVLVNALVNRHNAQLAAIKAKHAAEIDKLREALREIRELIEGYVDIIDRGERQLPNAAMCAQQIIDNLLSHSTEGGHEGVTHL